MSCVCILQLINNAWIFYDFVFNEYMYQNMYHTRRGFYSIIPNYTSNFQCYWFEFQIRRIKIPYINH